MKRFLLLLAAAASTLLPLANALAQDAPQVNQIHFNLTANPKFTSCVAQYPNDPNRPPTATVSVQRGTLNDTLTLTGKWIKPNLQFDLFTAEKSNLLSNGTVDPNFTTFGLTWYQSDVQASSTGVLATTTVKSILLDQIFGFDPDLSNPDPINTFHVGFWFNNPNDAVACGFDATKPTPFNGEHSAGPVAMISVPNALSNLGPLCTSPNFNTDPVSCNP